MATPRKHWHRTADAVWQEAWSNDQLATFCRLKGYLNSRRSRDGLDPDAACVAVIAMGTSMTLAGTPRARTAYTRLSSLCTLVDTLSVTKVTINGAVAVKIEWPKFAEFQGWPARESPANRPRVARDMPSPVPGSDSGSVTEEKSKNGAGAPLHSQPPDSEPRNRRAASQLDAEWDSMVKAFERYGKRPVAKSPARMRNLKSAIADHGYGVAAKIVVGYQTLHSGPGKDFDAGRYFSPDTLLRPSNRAKYLDAYNELPDGKPVNYSAGIGATRGSVFKGSMDGAVDDAETIVQREMAEHAKHKTPDPGCVRCRLSYGTREVE